MGKEDFERSIDALEKLSAYHDMVTREDVEFSKDAEPPNPAVILELIDDLYNPFSSSRGSFSKTDDVILALQREYNMKRGYELSRNNISQSKIEPILDLIDSDNPEASSLRFIRRHVNGKIRYRHPATSRSLSETTFFKLRNMLNEELNVEPEVMDSYLSFVSDATFTQRSLSSYE